MNDSNLSKKSVLIDGHHREAAGAKPGSDSTKIVNLDLASISLIPVNTRYESKPEVYDIRHALRCIAPMKFPNTLPDMPKHIQEGYLKNGCNTLEVRYIGTLEIDIDEIDIDHTDTNNSARVKGDPDTLSRLINSFENGYDYTRPRLRLTLIPDSDLERVRAKKVPTGFAKKYWMMSGHNRYEAKIAMIMKHPNRPEYRKLLVDLYEHPNNPAVAKAASTSNIENLPSCPDRMEDVYAKWASLLDDKIYTQREEDYDLFIVEYGFNSKFSVPKLTAMKKKCLLQATYNIGNDTIVSINPKGKVAASYSTAWNVKKYNLSGYYLDGYFKLTNFLRYLMPQTGEIITMIGYIDGRAAIKNGGVNAERKRASDEFNQSNRKFSTTMYDWAVRAGATFPSHIKDREEGIQLMYDNSPIKLGGFLPQRAKLGTHGAVTDMIEKTIVDVLGRPINLVKEIANNITKFIKK